MIEMNFNVSYIKFGKTGKRLKWNLVNNIRLVSFADALALELHRAISNSKFGVPVNDFIIRRFVGDRYDLCINGAPMFYSKDEEEFVLKLNDTRKMLAFINGG